MDKLRRLLGLLLPQDPLLPLPSRIKALIVMNFVGIFAIFTDFVRTPSSPECIDGLQIDVMWYLGIGLESMLSGDTCCGHVQCADNLAEFYYVKYSAYIDIDASCNTHGIIRGVCTLSFVPGLSCGRCVPCHCIHQRRALVRRHAVQHAAVYLRRPPRPQEDCHGWRQCLRRAGQATVRRESGRRSRTSRPPPLPCTGR